MTENIKHILEQKDTDSTELHYLVKPINSIITAPSTDWIVKNMFAKKTVSFMFGEAGSGKTFLIQDLLLKLSNGSDVFSGIPVLKSRVLLIEGDTTDSLLRDRFMQMTDKSDFITTSSFLYVNKYNVEKDHNEELNLSTEKGRANFAKCITSSKCDFVVIDTLISFIDNENDQVEMQKVISFLRKIAYQNNCHILICHHCRKKEAGDKRTRLSQSDMIGTSVLNRLASFIISVEKDEDTTEEGLHGVIRVSKSWYNQIYPIHFVLKEETKNNKTNLTFTYKTQTEAPSKQLKNKVAIKNHLKENNIQKFTRKELSDQLPNISESSIKTCLSQLEEEGYITSYGYTNSRYFEVVPPNYEPNDL